MKSSSFREILKSSVLIGGSSIISVLLATVRTKVMAVLIGTEGMGLFGAYASVTTMVSTLAGLGISSSGVRQIAEVSGSGDPQGIARTAGVLRRTSFALGFVGMVALLVLCKPISLATFGETSHAAGLAVLSVTILFSAVAGGQTALLQGLRRVRDVAALNVWSAVLGTACSIPIIFLFREKGIVPFLVVVSALSIVSSWWYVRKVRLDPVSLPGSVVWAESRSLLRMGLAFMATGLMVSAVGYITRVMVIREMNLSVAGLYQAAVTVSSVYVGFILGGMGADYYPRLAAVAGDNNEVNRLVNEQTEATVLMAVPGLLATLTFAPWIIHLLYSTQFEPAVGILRWQLCGILGRVIVWPMLYVLHAKGRALTVIWTELAASSVHLGLNWLGIRWFGADGLGMAFLGLYLFYGLLMFAVIRRMSGFFWTADNLCLGGGALLLMAFVFLATSSNLPLLWGMVIGSIITGVAAWYAVRRIAARAGYSNLTGAWTYVRGRLSAKVKDRSVTS